MNNSGELATERGVLEYEKIENTVKITGYRGKDTAVEVPGSIDGYCVTCIGKKAFLSNKMVKQISLPESILQIEDWAFAFCGKLAKIILPYHDMEIGQGIFKDCSALVQIIDEHGDECDPRTEDISYLLAAVMSQLDAFYLFDFENAGTEEWQMGCEDAPADADAGCGGVFQDAFVRGRGLWQQGEQSGLLYGTAQEREGQAGDAQADA